ncbi:MAG: hypothetical protein HOD64_00630 [Candidatus Cloacimonetes bacterium]|mgnify:CR=1 FL=1|nr:hypothetical protein [Candidatus Cloacimonadota bacterium]MBT4331758.1 hypothetical protein [Candidatus Cloacimonadota bacterium]
MDLKIKIDNFNKRWKLMDDESLEDGFEKFKIRVLNILKDIDSYVGPANISTFCLALGIQENYNYDGFSHYSNIIINTLRDENNIVKFFRMIEIIFNLEFKNERKGKLLKEISILQVEKAFQYSNINARIEKIEDEIIILPAGEKLLDEEVINHVLSFLDGDALLHFVDALKDFELNTEKSRVNSVDHLRRSLEEQFREELENSKGLQKNIIELSRKLKLMEVNDDVRKMVAFTLKSLDQLFNENSKHNDGSLNEPENEYLIYQVALLMRYVHKILIIQD